MHVGFGRRSTKEGYFLQRSAERAEGLGRLARNSLYLVGSRWLNYAIRMVYLVFLAKLLGPEKYGLYGYGVAWYLSFLPFTSMGLGVILSREVGKRNGQGQVVVSQTFGLQVVVALIAFAISVVLAFIVEKDTATRMVILVFSISIVARALAMWVEQVYTAYEVNQYSFYLESAFRPAEVALGVGILLSGYGLFTIAGLHSAIWAIQAVVGVAMVFRFVGGRIHIVQWAAVKAILIQGLPIGLSFIFVNWFLQGPIVLFKHVEGAGPGLGQLALTMQVFILFSSVPSAVCSAALPGLSRSVMRKDRGEQLFLEIIMKSALIIGTIIGFSFALVGPGIVDFTFGAEYALAGKLLGPGLGLLVVWSWGSALWRVLLARGIFFGSAASAFLGAAALTASLSALVERLGVLGAVVANAVGMGVWIMSMTVVARISGGLEVGGSVVRAAAASCLAVVVFLSLWRFDFKWACAAALCAVISGAVAFRAVSKDELRLGLGLLLRRKQATVA
jgi:O-antigen/teichoic acid export membrane protein